MVLLSADIFLKISLFVVFFFFSEISEECQAVWIQIMPVGPNLGPNCLQRLSADDTTIEQIRELTRNSESGIYLKSIKYLPA